MNKRGTGIFGSVLGIVLLNAVVCFGQTNSEMQKTDLAPPSQEKFMEVDAVASPWRISGCNPVAFEFREPGCYTVTEDKARRSNIVYLYNEDGSIWDTLDLNLNNDASGVRARNKDFVPLLRAYIQVLLRMTGESEHWYKVEVNERTQATKYALKGEPQWGKTSWAHWIYESRVLWPRDQKLLNRPEGTPIEDVVGRAVEKVNIVQVDGDWVLVNEFANKDGYRGWIRWRDGRKILVGCIFTGSSSWGDENPERK